MTDKVVKHKDAAPTVGEEVDSVEWASEEIHELPTDSILVVSKPPSTYYKVYGIYMRKTGNKYQPVFIVESEPVP